MSTTIGEAVIKLTFNTKDLDKGQQQIANKVDSVLGKVGSVAKTGGKLITAGMTAAATAVSGLAAASVKGYAEYEQLQGGVETLFKESSDQLMAYAEQSYKTTQLSAAQYMETATSFSASLIQGLGGDTAKAADYADRAIVSMSDNANKMGTSIENIQSAYAGFAKQNYTMLDNLKLGYGGTKTEMERLIKDASQMGDEMKKLGVTVDADSMSFDNIVNAIAVMQEHMGIAGTSAKEASKTISGSLASMKASAQDLITGITNPNADIEKLVDNFVNTIDSVADNIGPAIKSALKGITKLVDKGLPKIFEHIPDILGDIIPDLIDSAVALFTKIMDYLPQLVQLLINLFVQISQAIIPQIPVILMSVVNAIIDAIKLLTSPENLQAILQVGIQLLMQLVAAIPDILIALIDALPDIIMNIVDFLTDPENIMMIIEAAVQLFMGLVMAVPKILGKLFEAFGKLFGKLWEKCAQLFKDFAANFGEAIASVFKGAVNGVLWFLEQFINGPIDIINFFIDAINGILSLVGGHIDKLGRIQLPRLAEGGIATSATPALIGEAGKEAVIPLERNTDNWAGLLAHTLANEFEKDNLATGGGITVYMTNNINNNLDADEIGRRLMTSIRRAA